MYDNVDFKLRKDEAGGIDFLKETPLYFDVTGEHYFENGEAISGSLNGYKITVTENGVNIRDRSLCKYHLGNNFQTLGRSDTQRAIEKLSDTLHLPINEAIVTRLDIAQNFIVKHPISVYLNHLGELRHGKRSICADSSLYYYLSKGILIFYDKVKEQKAKGQPIPEIYTGRYTLRYEQRYRKRLPAALGVERVTGAMLYDEAFYVNVVNRWKENYKAIKKINDVTLNFEAMTTKKELYQMGLLSLMEATGGELGIISQINEAQQRGDLTKKQAFDLRQAVKEACKIKDGLTVKNEAILELDRKVSEAAKFYR